MASPGETTPRVLVVGGQGVLGSLLVDAFSRAGWSVLCGGRRPDSAPNFRLVDLSNRELTGDAVGEVGLVVNAVPDGDLTVERTALERGGTVINVSALPASAGRRLRGETSIARGTVVMNAGIAPGVTNLVAADLLAAHPEADEVEIAFTVSTRSSVGRAGRQFAHRGLTAVGRHRTAVIPLPEPFGRRRCLGFAEPDRGWLGAIADGRAVSPYVCISEGSMRRALLAINGTGMISRLPRAAFAGPSDHEAPKVPSQEPIAHWVAVRRRGRRLAASTVRCRGDYRCAAESTVVFAHALLHRQHGPPPAGVFGPEDLLSLDQMSALLQALGIMVTAEPV